jgi:hypothetical protein
LVNPQTFVPQTLVVPQTFVIPQTIVIPQTLVNLQTFVIQPLSFRKPLSLIFVIPQRSGGIRFSPPIAKDCPIRPQLRIDSGPKARANLAWGAAPGLHRPPKQRAEGPR